MDFPKARVTTPKNPPFLSPTRVFLILGLVFGIAFCIFIPYGAGFDEEMHLIRIVDISNLHMLPNRSKNMTVTYREFYSLSYQRRFFNDPASDLFSPENLQKTLNPDTRLRAQTRSIYSPIIFFPQAFIAGISWRILNLPILPVIILQRLAGFLLYAAAAYITIRILPVGKWVFAVLALAPMTMFQATTLNADGFTNAVSFLFIGATLKAYADQEREGCVTPSLAWTLAGLSVLLGLAKPGSIVLLPLLLILFRRRFVTKRFLVILSAGVLLAVLVTFGWTALSVPNSHFSNNGSQDIGRQLRLVLANPLDFLKFYIVGGFQSLGSYFRDWVGVYGYWVGEVPEPVYWLFPLALLAALLVEPPDKVFSWKVRAFMALLFAVSSGAIMLLYFFLHYTPGGLVSLGRQGRYFIPMAPLFFLALAGLVSPGERFQPVFQALTFGLLGITVGFYSLGLYATYYTECGYSVYAGRSCVLPVYKNLDIATPPEVRVDSKTPVRQNFISRCGNVEAVEVMVNSVPANASGAVRYELLDSSGQVLAAKDIPLAQIQAKKTLTLPVAASPASVKDRGYQIRLTSVNIPTGQGLGIMMRAENYYRDGELMIGEGNPGSDLVFQYACPNPFTRK